MCRRVKEETEVGEVFFNTNGMLLDEETCRLLAEAGFDKIHLSVDGRSPEENDRIRAGAKYQGIVRNVSLLRRFLKTTQVVIVNTIIKRTGDPEIPTPPDFLLNDFPGLPIWTTYAMKWPGLDITKSALQEVKLAASPHVDLFCKMPFTQMAVRSNGDVLLCCYDLLGRFVLGNVRQHSLMDIWQGDKYRQIRQAMLERNVNDLPATCQQCQQYHGEMLLQN